MRGVIEIERGKTLIRYTDRSWSQAEEIIMWWEPVRITRSPYRPAFPQAGDEVECRGDEWHGPGYSLCVPGKTQAIKVERRPVPPPKVKKGTEIRWHEGAWQKLSARKGWVPA